MMVQDRYILLDHLPKKGVVAEVGIAGGNYSVEILKRTNPQKLWLIDNNPRCFEKTLKRPSLKSEVNIGRVKFKLGLSWDVLAQFPANTFDWIYIDADHSYEAMMKDLEQAVKVVKKDGIIIANDYIRIKRYGIIPAVNEFCHKYDWELIFFALERQMFCDVALRKITT